MWRKNGGSKFRCLTSAYCVLRIAYCVLRIAYYPEGTRLREELDYEEMSCESFLRQDKPLNAQPRGLRESL